MAVNLKFATWNATGIMSGASYVNNLLKHKHIDILGLSEHWLSNSNMHFLDSINRTFSKKDHFFGQKISKNLCLVFDFICIYYMSSDY